MKFSMLVCLIILIGGPGNAQTKIKIGNNSSEYARDGECDDRRFVGRGMARSLDWDDAGHDAADCREALELGTITLWREERARAATRCSAIRFGDDTSEFAKDDVCDDPRFEGPGTSSIVLFQDTGHDAADCKRACSLGTVFLRNY